MSLLVKYPPAKVRFLMFPLTTLLLQWSQITPTGVSNRDLNTVERDHFKREWIHQNPGLLEHIHYRTMKINCREMIRLKIILTAVKIYQKKLKTKKIHSSPQSAQWNHQLTPNQRCPPLISVILKSSRRTIKQKPNKTKRLVIST